MLDTGLKTSLGAPSPHLITLITCAVLDADHANFFFAVQHDASYTCFFFAPPPFFSDFAPDWAFPGALADFSLLLPLPPEGPA